MRSTPDLLDLQSLLPAHESQRLERLRQALDAIDRETVDHCWERAEFPHDLVPLLADAGLLSLHLGDFSEHPESSWLFRGLAVAELSRLDASLATFTGVSASLFGLTVHHFGSDDQRRELLPQISTGAIVGAFGLTEPDHGSDVAGAMATTARRSGDDWILNGRKRWIGNATWSDYVVVWAREETDEDNRSAARPRTLGFVVPTKTPGFNATKIEGKYSLRTVQNADFSLTDVRLPESSRLPAVEHFRQTSEVLKYTRLEVAWAAIGNALGALDLALEHCAERQQFGRSLNRFQLVQDRLVDAQTDVTTTLATLAQAARLADEDALKDEQASFVKMASASAARRAVAACRELIGGDGITLEKRVIKHFMDAEAMYTFEGTHQINTLIVGRAITGASAFV